MQYPQVPGMSTGPDDDQAVPYNTPSVSTAPWVMPGKYMVRLMADGKTLTEPLTVVMDPRVKTPMDDLWQQFSVAKGMYDNLLRATDVLHEITELREQLKARAGQAPVASADAAIEAKLDAIAGAVARGRGGFGGGRGGPTGSPNLTTVRMQLARLEHEIESADAAPTAAQVEAFQLTAQPLAGLLEQWQQLKKNDLKALNEQLEREHFSLIQLDTFRLDHGVEDQIEIGDED